MASNQKADIYMCYGSCNPSPGSSPGTVVEHYRWMQWVSCFPSQGFMFSHYFSGGSCFPSQGFMFSPWSMVDVRVSYSNLLLTLRPQSLTATDPYDGSRPHVPVRAFPRSVHR